MADGEDHMTTCTICFEMFTDPHILPCNHTFCKTCIDEWQRKGSAALKCPKCRTGFRKDDVKPDFRLGEFLEVLSRKVQELTVSRDVTPSAGAESENEADKCEICESRSIRHSCEDCQQWMCDVCKKAHLRMKIAQNHKFVSIGRKKSDNKTNLEKEASKLVAILADYQRAVEKCQGGVDDTRNLQVATLKELADVRVQCHKKVDAHFDSLQQQIIAFIGNSLKDFQRQMKSVTTKVEEITKEKNNIESMIAENDDKLATKGADIMEKSGVFLGTLKPPEVDIRLPTVRLERSEGWAAKDAATLHCSDSGRKSTAAPDVDRPVVQTTSAPELQPTGPLSGAQTTRPKPKAYDVFFVQVYAWVADITRMKVDVVVNAAIPSLDHDGGVADAIARAAGRQLEDESRKYIRNYGSLPVGGVCVTSAGSMPSKVVVYTVGPRWSDYTDKKQCLEELYKCFCNCLNRADDNKYESIALPAISAGFYGVPKKQVATVAARAITDFCHTTMFSSVLKHIHLVDIRSDIISLYQKELDKCVDEGYFGGFRSVPQYDEWDKWM